MTTYAIAGATGQLGRLALDALLGKVAASDIVVLARDPGKAADFTARAVTVREGDYNRPETLGSALAGVDRLLLISGSEVGQRLRQHGAVIDAAKAAGVSFIAYTSVLHAPTSQLGLAEEHRGTEALLAASGVPHALLRNGWYSENYTGALAPAIEHGAIIGAAGEGRISAAARADYALAAAEVLTHGKGGDVHELAGDEAFTMTEFAALVSQAAGKPVAYVDMTPENYAKALEAVGLPDFIAAMLANSSDESSRGALFDDGRALSKLIGRPTTPIAQTIAAAI